MNEAHRKLANILRTDQDYILKIERRLGEVTGKKGVMESIVTENERVISASLGRLGVSPSARPREIFSALVARVEEDEAYLLKAFGNPDASRAGDLERVLGTIGEVAGVSKGFFLKEEKAREFLETEPPKKVLEYLGYSTAKEMLEKEDLLEVYSALRFVEDMEWMNGVFFKQYESLTPDDFEEREIRLRVLDQKWVKAAEHFLTHKLHNISHLKEMGVVFVIPATFGISGEILRMTSLIFHYLSEVPYYSDMFRRISADPKTFSANLTSLLRGDVIEERPPESEKSLWLVVQRYLWKDDPNEWRLFQPHINPEAIHWLRAEENLIEVEKKMDHRADGLAFWRDLGFAADYFRDEDGNDILLSFDLVDVGFSLVKKAERVKFTYHQHEALWNKIFMEYFGREELARYSQEHLLKGYFEV